jgi:hypothetical protein
MTEEKKPKKEKKEKKEAKLEPKSMSVKIIFTAPMLGTAPANESIYEDFIGKKSSDAEKVEQELASLPQEELIEKGKTVFHRMDEEDDQPMLYDYQVKGFIKEAFRVKVEFGVIKIGGKDISMWNIDRIIDNYVYIYPREIPLVLPEGGKIDDCVRPLRAKTMRGERVALACSERVPKGTIIDIKVEWLHPDLEKHIIEALNYGAKKGIGQWRNSGMGRFRWEPVA